MQDPMRAHLERLRAYKVSAQRRAQLYSEVSKVADEGVSDSLSALHKASAPGKKLQRAGFIMLWIPEPTGVTVAMGAPMILAGRFLDKKYNGATISDIGHDAHKMESGIRDMQSNFT